MLEKTTSPEIQKYPRSMVLMHWSIATCMIIIILCVSFFTFIKYGTDAPRGSILSLYAFKAFIGHETFGIFVLFLGLWRLINTFLNRKNKPKTINVHGSIKHYIEKITHFLLQYALILLTMLGWYTANAKGYAIKLFNSNALILPDVVTRGDPTQVTTNTLYQWLFFFHSYLGYALVVLVLMHIGAVIFNNIIKGENLMKRMSCKK